MASRFVVPNIREALAKRMFPSITLWNRLEGRPRAEDFSRALRAEVRDALWMVTKQWQMGEYHGDDAGSPVLAKVHLATTQLTKYQAGSDTAIPFEGEVPLEAKVEQRAAPVHLAGQAKALDLRILMGRQWLKMIASIGSYAAAFLAKYPIPEPDPRQKSDAAICAHRESWSVYDAVAGRMMDGAALYFHLKANAANHPYDGIAVNAADQPALDSAAARFVAWREQMLYEPGENDAWEPDRLEYAFACSAPDGAGEKVFECSEFYQGHLDWHNFDIDASSPGLGPADPAPADPQGTQTLTLIPTPVSYAGMPNTRWWAFEDGRTNFGDIKPDTTDLAKLLLIEFGLVYANDWFLIPFKLPIGSIAKIRGMAVTNVFGERTWIEAAGRGADDNWQRWSMFTVNTKQAGGAADNSLLLLPTTPKALEGAPLEDVMLIRDEMANMVWGIEKSIALPSGDSKSGDEAAAETLAYFKRILAENGPPPASGGLLPNDARIRYQAMTSVPENWIPFIPVHVPGDTREIQLQRASMLRILEGDPSEPVPVQPRTSLLRQGLDASPAQPYFVHEEEAPRAGVRATLAFRRSRWMNGKVFTWLAVRKQTGRGEGSSGLAFDRIADIPNSNA